jgi:hypothetical protein
LKVIKARDLAGRVAIEREQRVFAIHPDTVIDDSDSPLATRFDIDSHRSRPGVESILDQFLDDRGGPLDNLAGGDLANEPIT